MALLADTFFSDFDELLDNEADIFDEHNFDVDNMEEDDEEMMGMASVVAVMFLNMTNSVYRAFKLKEENEADILDEDNLDVEIMEEDADGDLADIEALNYDDLHSVSNLQKTLHYVDIMQVGSCHSRSIVFFFLKILIAPTPGEQFGLPTRLV
ncbi:unnamed protein product [Ilex paraguariensis]|uniref:Uncharacterized protein n=1 Tax=Ilex paraguariensis TaxID=185542 RepID=A0ABC8R5B7_9AQUA